MFVIPVFCFELLKIAILSSIYALIVLLIAMAARKLINVYNIKGLLNNKFKFWKTSFKIIYALLFIFMFTYWGDHGLGDDAYLPVGHFQVVNQSDGTYAYLEDRHGNQLSINNFTFDKDYLYAEAGKDEFGKIAGEYVIWDLKNNEYKFYTKNQYLYTKYPTPGTFSSFNDQYNKYWNGWSFWLLP